jgi:hypothetical protein
MIIISYIRMPNDASARALCQRVAGAEARKPLKRLTHELRLMNDRPSPLPTDRRFGTMPPEFYANEN